MLFRRVSQWGWFHQKKIGSRKAGRRNRHGEPRWGFLAVESLEARQLMAAATPETPLTSAEQVVANRVRALSYDKFKNLQASEVQYLSTTQLQGISKSSVLTSMTVEARAALSADQIRLLSVGKIGLVGLTPLQIDALTVTQIQSLKAANFGLLLPAQIPSLTTNQVKTLSKDSLLRALPADRRAALTAPQIQALPVKSIGLGLLTDAQIGQLTVAQIQSLPVKDVAQLLPSQMSSLTSKQWTAYSGTVENASAPATQQVGSMTVGQIRALKYWQFNQLSAEQVKFLTAPQFASIPGSWHFQQMSASARGALTQGQVRSLMVGSVDLDGLTDQQIGWLSVPQIQSLNYWSFDKLLPAQTPKLTADQLRSIPGSWWFQQISAAGRAALTAEQIKMLNVAEIGLNNLNATQIGQLSGDQIRTLKYWDFDSLNAKQTPQLSAEQISSIPNEWWLGQIPEAARAALKQVQVQAMLVDQVGIRLLTPAQVKLLTTNQVQRVEYSDFQYLATTQTPLLTAEQLQSIPNGWWFERMSAPARAALTAGQVQSLDVGDVGLFGLTVTQRGALSAAQVQTLDYDDFRYLPASHTPFLSADQLGSIDNEWWFLQITDAARAALTGNQVRALDIGDVGLRGLTRAQVDQLTPAQIQEVAYWHLQYLTPSQAPNLSVEQLASIDNNWWFGQIPADARAALTATQVQSLHVEVVGLEKLTPAQIDFLTTEQIHDVGYWDFDLLHEQQIDDLTVEQIGSLPNCWWFENIPEDVRLHLTTEQIQALNVVNVTIDHLAASQRLKLTTEQIQSLDDGWYFSFLTANQAEQLLPEQMELIDSGWEFHRMSDEARAALSREQLLAMPEHVHAQLLGLEAGMFSPEGHAEDEEHHHDEPPPAPAPTTGPHTDDPVKREEHLALFDLVPREAATFVTIASGNWNDAATWRNGAIPNGGAQVLVSAGTTVTFNAVQTNAMKWVRVDGTLEFATTIDTQMLVDTVIVDPAGALRIGTGANPVASGVAARIVIADNGQNIDQAWDPLQLSRGLISHGTVEMHGETVTPYVSLDRANKNATQLTLDSVPTNWRVGDRLVLTGTTTDISAKQDEELKLVAINGNTITIDSNDDVAGNQGLKFNHVPPQGFGLKVYVADMNRNVVIMSQNPAITQRRGHVMFMHSPKVEVENVGFYGLGRTDKRNPINDPVFDDDGNLLPTTSLNPRGRYAVHFHRQGIDGTKTPAEISGSVVVDSPGWGFVNHDSNVNMTENVAFNVQGASFVSEIGNEIGSMVRNLSIRNEGSGDGLEDRQDIFDFGHGGDGFWLQGPGVRVVDNIAASAAESGYIFFTASSEAEFDAANLDDPSLAAGQDSVPVGTVPFKEVSGNTAFASGSGLETWFHLTHMNDGQSYIDGMTTWNTGYRGIFTPYTGRTTIRDALVLGHLNGWGVWGVGIDRNDVTNNMTYEDVRVEGWEEGICVPVNRATVISDGVFRNIRNINIDSAEDTIRTVDIVGDPQFLTLTEQQLGGRQQFDVFLNGEINLRNRDIEMYFSPDIVRLGTVRFNDHQIYYDKQAADYVPFVAGSDATWLPPEIIGKTNQQLWDQYGVAPAGIIAPADAVRVPGINGLVGSRSTYLPELELVSDKYTNQPLDYHLRYVDPIGDLISEETPTRLREGWNLLTREIAGETRTFFVYGDTVAPTFTRDPNSDLRVNPQGLKFGFVVYGTVFDESFGEMHFRRKFDDLQSRTVKTDSKGKKYIDLDFTIRDLAGNTTSVVVKVMLDPNAPIVPGTQQRDLPPREVPRTLAALLEYYFLTGQGDGDLRW